MPTNPERVYIKSDLMHKGKSRTSIGESQKYYVVFGSYPQSGNGEENFFLRLFKNNTEKYIHREFQFKKAQFCGFEIGSRPKFRRLLFKTTSRIFFRLFFTDGTLETLTFEFDEENDLSQLIHRWQKKITKVLGYRCAWNVYVKSQGSNEWSEGYGKLHLTCQSLALVTTHEKSPQTLENWKLSDGTVCSHRDNVLVLAFKGQEKFYYFETTEAKEIAQTLAMNMPQLPEQPIYNAIPPPTEVSPGHQTRLKKRTTVRRRGLEPESDENSSSENSEDDRPDFNSGERAENSPTHSYRPIGGNGTEEALGHESYVPLTPDPSVTAPNFYDCRTLDPDLQTMTLPMLTNPAPPRVSIPPHFEKFQLEPIPPERPPRIPPPRPLTPKPGQDNNKPKKSQLHVQIPVEPTNPASLRTHPIMPPESSSRGHGPPIPNEDEPYAQPVKPPRPPKDTRNNNLPTKKPAPLPPIISCRLPAIPAAPTPHVRETPQIKICVDPYPPPPRSAPIPAPRTPTTAEPNLYDYPSFPFSPSPTPRRHIKNKPYSKSPSSGKSPENVVKSPPVMPRSPRPTRAHPKHDSPPSRRPPPDIPVTIPTPTPAPRNPNRVVMRSKPANKSDSNHHSLLHSKKFSKSLDCLFATSDSENLSYHAGGFASINNASIRSSSRSEDERHSKTVEEPTETEIYDISKILNHLHGHQQDPSYRLSTKWYVNILSIPPLPPRDTPDPPQRISTQDYWAEDEYWSARSICHTLSMVLQRKPPTPDTLRLSYKSRTEVCLRLYINSLGTCDWRDLASEIGLEHQAIELTEAFTVHHNNETAGEIVLRHWQYRYNKYGKHREKCPVECTREGLITTLKKMYRHDVLEIINNDRRNHARW